MQYDKQNQLRKIKIQTKKTTKPKQDKNDRKTKPYHVHEWSDRRDWREKDGRRETQQYTKPHLFELHKVQKNNARSIPCSLKGNNQSKV